jgi:excisionase family DNA binding protein
MDANRQYLKAEEVAEILSMDVSGIYRMCRDRTLPSIRIGTKTVRIPRAGLEALLARSTQGPDVVAPALEGAEDTVAALERQAASFTERTGQTHLEFLELWRLGRIADDAANADFAIEALSLRQAMDRPEGHVPAGDRTSVGQRR